MSKKWMIVTAVIGVAGVIGVGIATSVISAHNREVRLRDTLLAKQVDNQSEYDSLWKKIAQATEVTEEQRVALIEIFREHAAARGGGSDARIASWLHESVPNVDTTTFNNLQNIIAGSRDRFAMRQKELLDIKREHDIVLDSFPSGAILAMLGREKMDVTIITSQRTQETFRTGMDDDVRLPKRGR